MGIQFILGLRARRNRGSNPADSGHPGSVRENIGRLWCRSAERRETEGRLEFALPTAFIYFAAVFCELRF